MDGPPREGKIYIYLVVNLPFLPGTSPDLDVEFPQECYLHSVYLVQGKQAKIHGTVAGLRMYLVD